MRRLWSACATVMVLGIATPALAGQPRPPGVPGRVKPSVYADALRAAWYNINDLVVASAEKMPEEHYGFRPTREVRTFGQILAHIAADNHATCGATVGHTPPEIKFDDLKTKDEIRKVLQDSAAVCDLAFGLLTDQNASFRYRAFNADYTRAALLIATVTHVSEHYGNLVSYMRWNNVVPPSTAGVR